MRRHRHNLEPQQQDQLTPGTTTIVSEFAFGPSYHESDRSRRCKCLKGLVGLPGFEPWTTTLSPQAKPGINQERSFGLYALTKSATVMAT
jgi:hypothetical protein